MDERVIEFTDYFEDVVWQEPKRAPLSNEQARKIIENAYYRNIITDAGYTNLLRELKIYSANV